MLFSPQSLWMGIESLVAPTTLLTIGIRGVLLLAAAALLVRVAFKASAASRHLIWAMAMVALLLLPVLTAMLPALQVQGPGWITAAALVPLTIGDRCHQQHLVSIDVSVN